MNCQTRKHLLSILFVSLVIQIGCYSFKGISIPPEVNTFYISTFENRASNSPAGIEQRFSEKLKEKIRNESRLKYTEDEPDIEFDGYISSYNVRSMAPTEGNETAFNRLNISVSVNYTNPKNEDEDEDWQKTFSWYQDFTNEEDLSSVQDDFIDDIFDQLAEDIFNQAFTNW